MKLLTWIFVAASAVGLASIGGGGCNGQTGRSDSNSNWLRPCEHSNDCEVGTCLCGFCTKACGTTAQCDVPETRCVATANIPLQCAETAAAGVTGVCLAECESSSDCSDVASGLVCVERACVAGTTQQDAGANDGASTDGSPADADGSNAALDALPPPNFPDAVVGAGDPPLPGLGEPCLAGGELIQTDADTSFNAAPNLCAEGLACDENGTCQEIQPCPQAGGILCRVHSTTETVSDIAVNATHLYWSVAGTLDPANNHVADGKLLRRALPDGPVEELVTGLLAPGNLRLTSQYLYWVVAVHPASDLREGELWRLPLGGAAIDATPLPVDILKDVGDRRWTTDDVNLYWAHDGDLVRAPMEGSPVTILDSQSEPGEVVLDATHLYWLRDGLHRVSKTGTDVEQIASLLEVGGYGPTGVDVTDGAVLVTADSSTVRVDKSTFRVSYLASLNAGTSLRPVVGNGFVYWRIAANEAPPSGIYRVPTDGSTPAEMVVASNSVDEIEVAPAGLFWRVGGEIQMMAP